MVAFNQPISIQPTSTPVSQTVMPGQSITSPSVVAQNPLLAHVTPAGIQAKLKKIIAYSDTHGNYQNYGQMINAISTGNQKETSVLFNGDFCTYFSPNGAINTGNTAAKNQQHIHFLDTFTGNWIDKDMLRIFNLGNHEFLGGKYYIEESQYWRKFVNIFDIKKKLGQNIHMLNSCFLPAFNYDIDKKNIEPYIALGNVGYVSWSTMEIFANNKHNGSHNPNNWFRAAWIASGCIVSNTLNFMRSVTDPRHIINGYPIYPDIYLGNLIIDEFLKNVKKCIDEMVTNSPNDKLYLNVASHEARWGILPVLAMVLNVLRQQDSKYNQIFQRLVINIITGHDHNEKDPNRNHSPYCLLNCGNIMNNRYWLNYGLSTKYQFQAYPIINILTPGPYGGNNKLDIDFN
jgi:hypothetical protein